MCAQNFCTYKTFIQPSKQGADSFQLPLPIKKLRQHGFFKVTERVSDVIES
jgi:hypothetical protein